MKPDPTTPLDEVFDCYPVRHRGERRRLNPNQAGIAWLEEQSETDTEIAEIYSVAIGELRVQRALGYYSAKRRDMYPWPMFQTFSDFKANMLPYPNPCPDCDDWARTSRCTSHHDLDGIAGLKMGDGRRQTRQAQRETGASTPTRSEPAQSVGRGFFDQATAERVRLLDTAPDRPPCTCTTCVAIRDFTRPHSTTVVMEVEEGATIEIRLDIEF